MSVSVGYKGLEHVDKDMIFYGRENEMSEVKLHGYPVKVGDRVWHLETGWQTVIKVINNGSYCIRSDNGSFTCDGKQYEEDINACLFWQPIDPSAIEAAKVKKEPEYDYYWYCARIDMMTSHRYTKEFLFACFDNASEFSCIKESKREVKS